MLTEKQLELHNKYITGSKMASICNMSKWMSKYKLFALMKGVIKPDISTEAMIAGSYMESAIKNYAHDQWGYDIVDGPEDGKFHPNLNFCWGLVDGLIKKNGSPVKIIEVKNTAERFYPEWEEEGPPQNYRCQLYFYEALYDLPGEFIVCFGGNKIRRYDLPRNKNAEKYILAEATNFWDDLENNRWPPIDGSDSTKEAIKKVFPENNGSLIEGDDKLREAVMLYDMYNKRIKDYTLKMQYYENMIKNTIGEKDGVIFKDATMIDRVTWKKTKDSTVFDEKKFKARALKTWGKYQTIRPGHRRFHVHYVKE